MTNIFEEMFEANPENTMRELIQFLENKKITLYGFTLSRSNFAKLRHEMKVRGIDLNEFGK